MHLPTDPFERVRAIVSSYRVRETSAIAAARAYGIDIGLLKESLARTPLERLERAAALQAALGDARPVPTPAAPGAGQPGGDRPAS